MMKFVTALLCAMVWHGAAQAAEPVPDYMLYYSGEREFCLHLLRNADKAKKIEPVIGPTLTFDIYEGELYAPKLRLYIVKSPMPLPVIGKLITQRQWMTLLGYTPWKANSSAGRMVTDPRWRKYDDQCPGIFQLHNYDDPDKIIDTPTEMTLFNFDADGDGKRDMIYRYDENATNTNITVANFRTCTLQPIIWQREKINLYWFKGRTYAIAGSGTHMVSVYRINSINRKIDRNNDT